MATKIAFVIPAIKPRNPYALHAMRRKAVFMKDRRKERGGNKNKQREYRNGDY